MTISDQTLREKDRNEAELLSVLKKFHKDFKLSTDRSLRIDKARNEREIDERKRQTLNTVSNTTSITNISNISSMSKDKSGSVMSSIIIPATKGDKEVVGELKGINKTIETTAKEETKKNKSIFKNSILQARLVEGAFNYIKDFFLGGVSDTDRIVNAVNNVENAIRKQDKTILDERSRFQQLTGGLPETSVLRRASEAIPTTGTTVDKMAKIATSGTGAFSSAIGGFVSSIIDNLSSATEKTHKDPKVKKKTKDSTTNIASSFIEMLDKGMTSVLNGSLLKKKTGFLGAVALFGSATDLALSTAILNPIKTLKASYAGFKKGLGIFVDRPFLQGIALATSTFGAMGGAVATAFLPIAKIIRPLTKELPSFTDAFVGMKDKISEGTSNMLTKMRKTIGKKFIVAGVMLGGLGVKMLGIMGTIIAAGTAALPFIIGGLITAGVVAIGYQVYKHWNTVSGMWNEYIVQPIVDFMVSAVDKFKSTKESITKAISGFFDSIVNGARAAIEMLPGGETIADSIFGEKKELVKSNDTTQALMSSPEMIKEKTIIKQNNEEQTKVMNKLNKTLEELAANNRTPQSVPIPQSNIDDLGTYMIAIGD